MENWLFILFLCKLQGPLSFYTSLENNTIFLQHFSVSGRGWRILSPCRRQSYYFKMNVLKRRKLSFVLEWNKLFCDITPIYWQKATFHKSTTRPLYGTCTWTRIKGKTEANHCLPVGDNFRIFQRIMRWMVSKKQVSKRIMKERTYQLNSIHVRFALPAFAVCEIDLWIANISNFTNR